jgi:hypothetical protein
MCAVVPALLLSETFLSRDRLSFVIFTDNIRRKRQVSVRSSSQKATQVDDSRRDDNWSAASLCYPPGPTPHTPLTSRNFSIVGEVDQPKRWAWDEFHALCKRLPGGDH